LTFGKKAAGCADPLLDANLALCTLDHGKEVIKLSWNLAHNDHGLPIHANGNTAPHITIRDFNAPLGGGSYHVPYQGQTTLNMWMNGESFGHVSQNNLGSLNHGQATFTPWFK